MEKTLVQILKNSKIRKSLFGLATGIMFYAGGFGVKENRVFADTLNVPSQYSTIQSAVNASHDGDKIIVSPGRYLENVVIDGKAINIKSVNLLDENIVKSTIIDGQTINGVITLRDNINSTVTLEGLTITNGKAQYGGGINAKNSILSLDNCVVTSNSCFGGTDAAGGGGIYCENSTTTLRNCAISNNNVLGGTRRHTDSHGIITGYGGSGDGGGLYFLSTKAVINDCVITGNTSKSGDAGADGFIHNGFVYSGNGGGICVRNSIFISINSYVGDNSVAGGWGDSSGKLTPYAESGNALGGGLYIDSTQSSIYNSLIYNNKSIGGGIYNSEGYKSNGSAYGGGIYDLNSSISLLNSTITNNSIIKGEGGTGGNEIGGGLYGDYNQIINTILWNNRVNQIDGTTTSTQPLYSDIQGWTNGGEGNISLDPQFVDPANGDYHLQPSSPCIDAGMKIENLLFDIEGNPRGIKGTTAQRGDGSNYDMGAYEYNPARSAVNNTIWNMYE